MMPAFITGKRLLIAGALVVGLMLVLWLAGRYHVGKLNDLKAENARITDAYNQKIGEAHAKELAAREEAMKAQALVAAVEQGNRNVKALDAKIEQAGEKHEQAKAALGECADPDECLKLLCAELRAAGFKVDCPD